jgi:hypothetical protein
MNAENPVQIDLFGVSATRTKDTRLAEHIGGYVRAPSSLGVVMTVDTARLCDDSAGKIVGKASLPETTLNAARADTPTTAVLGAYAG